MPILGFYLYIPIYCAFSNPVLRSLRADSSSRNPIAIPLDVHASQLLQELEEEISKQTGH